MKIPAIITLAAALLALAGALLWSVAEHRPTLCDRGDIASTLHCRRTP